MTFDNNIAILGAGNLGGAIARGLIKSQAFSPEKIVLTRRHVDRLAEFARLGFKIEKHNVQAVQQSAIILITVEPQQIDGVLAEIKPVLQPERHLIISCVSGVSIAQIRRQLSKKVVIVRAMPNTGVEVGQSMTCLASEKGNGPALDIAREIFSTVGKTLVIDEDQMAAATALGACGVAYFLRAIRAASQGGIEIGFSSDKAMVIAAQTALAAASLLLKHNSHPEAEIDRVTTPRGITISGLNTMEHAGFSSAMIRGIVTSWEKAAKLYKKKPLKK